MDQGLKERLVGAAVLVAIAVWLIPWVLDGPEAPLETNGSSLQLPAAEEPMPMRSQTLRLGDAPEAPTGPAIAAAPTPAETTESVPAAAHTPPGEAVADDAVIETDEPVLVARSEPTPEPPAPTAETVSPPPAPAATAPKPAPAAAPAATGDWAVQ